MRSSTSASEAFRFALRAAGFAAPFALLAMAAAQWAPPAAPSDFMRGTVVKNRRLLALPSPKAILIGDSNLAYGVDSDSLGRALCLPVANMGLSCALGFRFMLEEAFQSVGPGDLLIVSLDVPDFSQLEPVPDALLTVLDYRRAAFALLPPLERPQRMAGLGVLHLHALWDRFWRGVVLGRPPAIAQRRWLPSGDLFTLGTPGAMEAASPVPAEYRGLRVDARFWEAAAALQERAQRAGAGVVFAPCPLAARTGLADAMEQVFAGLALRGHRVAGRPSDYVFADSLFIDTWHHLREPGRQLRTARLIRDLCAALPDACCAR